MSGFFSVGVMKAFLKAAGKWLRTSERLNTSTMNGARRSTVCFRVEVGNESAAAVERLSRPPAVRGVKAVNDAAERGGLKVGGGASALFEGP